MRGRDPHEVHRVATPLELLFDLTFVVAFGVAASQFAHLLAEGHLGGALAGFCFATFAVSWAWINFSWFASAYDTDDWVYRLTTMIQMVGVLILALGLPQLAASIDHGGHLDNRIVVAGYVVMRIALVAQWLRAAYEDPPRRAACLTYAGAVAVAQLGWIASIFVDTSVTVSLVIAALLALTEMSGPLVAERRMGGTPWHAHHIAERYGLLAIIALGEGVVGTVASLTAAVEELGWSTDTVLVAVAGTALTFGMWWVYFAEPFGPLLHERRQRSFTFGYLHIPVFGAIVATGAGLHTAAYYIEHHSALGATGTVLSVAVPVGVYILLVAASRVLLTGDRAPTAVLSTTLSAVVLVAAVVAAAAGVPMAWCLLIVTAAPVVTVASRAWLAGRFVRNGARVSRPV
ncbi:low temperature requirement protein A [Mycolicibacterium litorale]|uniref:Membrane protein n=1 Tax=Mycolicibacterium litorale TaxID=758802 RepID=A0AAD1IHP5_9MYCO|nr:low temperature requirement protein A [Mycolicibacterium litorale]MCV7413899.1 low temperature requirement protein A [Mycolicibacterium litorale]TDY03217.1 low temperature requirement protein LtrA [Mycolicibacterium litorale]BBY15011.1 membrane protein [Mycolicibacterium litorale]